MANLEFHFDFGSPNAYLSHLVIPEIEKRTGVKFEYVPVLLGGVFKATNNRSPAETNAGIKNKSEYGKLEMERFIKKHRLAFTFNPNFPVNTLMMMRGAVAAQQLGIFPRYVDQMYRFMWSEPRKMDDPAVVTATWKECGFDADRLGALIQDQAIKDKLVANTQDSVARGCFGSPTFFVGNEMFFGKDRLRDVEEMILEAKAT